jgi:hypothetical protein
MSTILDNKKSFTLSPDDRARLERFAPFFDIEFVRTPEGTYRIEFRVWDGSFVVTLSNEAAYRRLLAEICSRASTWVHFHLGEPCRDSLLNLSDAKVQRVAELYALSRRMGSKGAVGVGE